MIPLAKGQRGPSHSSYIAEKFVPTVNVVQLWPIYGKLSTVRLKTDLRESKRGSTLKIRDALFEPCQTRCVFRTLWMVAQCEERPGRRNNQRLTGDTVNHGIAAVPASPGTHAVIQHGFGKLPPAGRRKRKQVVGAFAKNEHGQRSRLDPAAGPGGPTPPTIRIVDGANESLG